MKGIISVLMVVVLAGCSDAPTAKRALEGAGYTDITITGWNMFGCDKHDTFSTGFVAKGPTGVRVSGVVCSGLLKGATIRTN
jgi:hypothetical protein